MIRNTLILLTLLALALTPLPGQNQQTNTLTGAEQQLRKLESLQNQVIQLRKDQKKAADEAASRSEKEGRVIREKYEDLIRKIEEREQTLKESIEREARKTRDDQLRTERNVWLVLLFAGLVICAVSFFLWVKSLEIVPVDPNMGDLRRAAEKSKRHQARFILSLDDGRRFKCIAEFRSADEFPIVLFAGTGVECKWKDRRITAEKLSLRVAS